MFELKLENSDGSIVNLNDGIRYEVITASGLNPPSASIFTSKSPNRKGLRYNGSTLNERVVVIQIKLHGNIEESRNALYEWVDPEQYAKIHYRNDTKRVYCEGHIEVCEVDPFTDNEIVNVEILCENPYWKDIYDMSVDIAKVLRQFTFPFSIEYSSDVEVTSKNLYILDDGTEEYREETTVSMSKGVPFSTIKDDSITNVFNGGAETGMQFVIMCIEAINSLLIFDANDTTKQFKITYPFEAGWQIIIDTEGSPKTCKAVKPDGTVLNVLRYVGINPTWFSLKKGNNKFGYLADDGAADVEMSIRFTNKYLGI